ncbi:hypothetical protein RIU80_08315 [Salmonella enterica subsp. enterica serovar Gatineau]|uniref:hypothetical protein n=1 Tax=Salmonella enterica TaxID=28901 RepID=UPI00285A6101|nr:hypothetical protein [Salmonella enterica]MDR7957156.1 hypothetical protein [Salmonella enterica subsp. enterica serovar Gatineau]MDR7965126.1 hypothetical protein [Salmonella enterica subsp. enterica serovar Gatineau]MDR7970871.1 hypothetical protein [Salmonella enterica subsp. enterica serovar Gatineau]
MNNTLILNSNNILSTGFIVDLRSNANVTKSHITPWLSSRLLCNCQDFENLALEDVDIMPKDASHVDATARVQIQLTPGENKTATLFRQEIVLQRIEGARMIADVIREQSGSLLAQMRTVTIRIEKE